MFGRYLQKTYNNWYKNHQVSLKYCNTQGKYVKLEKKSYIRFGSKEFML